MGPCFKLTKTQGQTQIATKCKYPPYLHFFIWTLSERGRLVDSRINAGSEEWDEVDEGEDESFVVLMLNELENTIELL